MPLLLCNCSRMRRHLHASPPAIVFFFFLFSPSLLWLEDGAFIHPPLFDISAYFFFIVIINIFFIITGWRWTSSDDGIHWTAWCFCARLVKKKKKKKKGKNANGKKKDCVFDLDVDCRGLFVDQPEAFFLPRGAEIEEGGGENGPWSDAWDATVRDNKKKNNNNNNRRFIITSESNFHLILRAPVFLLFCDCFVFFLVFSFFFFPPKDYDSWQESQMWLCGWHVVVFFYIPSSPVSWLRVALSSSSRPLSRSLLLWVAHTHTHTKKKHVGYFLLQAQCIWKKGVFESSSRESEEEEEEGEEGEEEENGPWKMKNLTVFFWGAVEDACSCLSNEYWRSVSAGWKGKSLIRIGLDTHAISGARAFYFSGCGVNEKILPWEEKNEHVWIKTILIIFIIITIIEGGEEEKRHTKKTHT